MKKFNYFILFIVIIFFGFISTHDKFIIYHGDKFYYCGTTGSGPDTLVTPDGSLRITINKKITYNHFGCENIDIH